jgi:hypothetical protein
MPSFSLYIPLSAYYPRLFNRHSLTDVKMSAAETNDTLPSRDVLNDAHEVFMGSSTKTARIQARLMSEVCRDFMVSPLFIAQTLFINV